MEILESDMNDTNCFTVECDTNEGGETLFHMTGKCHKTDLGWHWEVNDSFGTLKHFEMFIIDS